MSVLGGVSLGLNLYKAMRGNRLAKQALLWSRYCVYLDCPPSDVAPKMTYAGCYHAAAQDVEHFLRLMQGEAETDEYKHAAQDLVAEIE